MRVLTVEQMRSADRAAVTEAGIPELTLMMRAGSALARVVAAAATRRRVRNVVLVAGAGNNGGDACVAAYCLHEEGLRVHVILTCTPAMIKGTAHEAWDIMRTAGVPYVVLASPESWDKDIAVVTGMIFCGGIIVDGLLGTGCSGAARGVTARAIEWINQMRGYALVVAADLPSGLQGDSGMAEGTVVNADITVTFARPKPCFLQDATASLVGHLVVADIGIPDEICDREVSESNCRLVALPELQRSFVVRRWDAHKGDYGHTAILGGSVRLPHAPVLAALGALYSGAGLVTLVVPPASTAAAGAWTPTAMLETIAAPQGELTVAALTAANIDLSRFAVLVLGPGLALSPATTALVKHLLENFSGKIVLDADGLNALAALHAADEWSPREEQQLILTPHPGEAARLLTTTNAAVQADRPAAVKRLADTYQATVALKGAGTLVCAPYDVPLLNRTGNPGMACGGMGDVLAGMAGALWAQGLSPLDALATAVWAHGAAGDYALFSESSTSLTPVALVEQLGQAFQRLESFNRA